jgi:polysaccharide export outer membrane protein
MRNAFCILLLLGTGCSLWGSAETQGAKPSGGGKAAEAKPRAAGAQAVDTKNYIIGPEDMLLIRVWREPELSGQFPVRPDGRISLPLVNEIQAAGLTPEQLGAAITQGLGKYMTQPEVSVAVVAVNSKKYYVIGEVVRTGPYPLTVPTTVLEALVTAGGFRDFANPKKIVILRGAQRLKFNYKEVVAGKNAEQNVLLENGDKIIVP